MKIFVNILLFIRNFFISIFKKVFGKVTDEETGKLIFFKDPANAKKTFFGILIAFFVAVGAYKMITSRMSIIDGTADFKEEQEGDFGIRANEEDINIGRINDPLEGLLNRRVKDEPRSLIQNNDDDNDISASVCLKLLDKLKNGQKMNMKEKSDLKYCLDNNIANLDRENMDIARRLLGDTTLSLEEKQALRDLFENAKECQDTINQQMATDDGNLYWKSLLENKTYSNPLIEVLQNDALLKNIIANPQLLKTQLGYTDSEVKMLIKVLEDCPTDVLLKMLSDPKYRAIFSKLLDAAKNDPKFFEKLLNSEDVTDAEKDLLRRFLNDELDMDSDEYAIAQGLLSSDPNKKQLARDLLKARDLGETDLANKMLDALKNGGSIDYDSDALNKAYLAKQAGQEDLMDLLLKKARGDNLSKEELALLAKRQGFNVDPTDPNAYLPAITDDLAKRQAEIDKLKEKLSLAQARAREAAERLEKGLKLTPEQLKSLAEYTDLERKLKELEAEQRKRQAEALAEYSRLKALLDSTGVTWDVIFPSGMVLEENAFNFKDCKDVKPFKIVRILKKNKNKGKKKRVRTKLVDSSGRELTAEQKRLLMAYGKEKSQALEEKDKLEDSVYNALSDNFIPSSAVALNQQIAQTQGGEGNQDLKGLFSENNNLKPFSLSPDMSVAGLMLTEILVADSKNQKVRVKIMQDIYDSNSGNIIVSKGSLAIGRTSGFDADTGIMNLSLNTIVKDGKSLDISFSVSSADMTDGLKGQVYDARGKHLFGTFVSSFTSGALGALSQSYISPLQNSSIIGDTMTGAALQGAATVGQRIADTYAGDLQNAPRIFFAPAGVKVVLHPNE